MSMFSQYPFHPTPKAPAASIVASATQRITILTDGLVRLETDPKGEFEDRASTFAINRDLPTPKYHVIRKKDESGGLEIITDRIHLLWTGEEFSPTSLHVLLRDKGWDNKGWTHEWRYGDRHFKMTNLAGTYRTLDRIDGRCDLGDGILSQYGLAVLDDSESMLFTEDGWVAGRDQGKSDVYLFAYGLDYREALKAFYTVSGKTPLIPRWALGNWWSRYYAYSQQEYLDLMDRFKQEKIPLSVGVLDIDWHLIDVPAEYGTGWTGYTWDKKLFPDHKQFLKDLHERNLKVSLNVHPADGVRSFEKQYKDMCEALQRDSSSGVPVPFESTSREFMEAYFKLLHHPIEDEGADFWWMDWQQGPFSEKKGLDPLWILNHYHYLDSGRKGDRRFAFSRYAGPGSHRYPIGFSGDTVVSWKSLEFQPEFTSTAANIGYGWWSNDIGGHYHGTKDDELYARWVQLGCFSPILRLHSSQSPFNSREPWVYSKEAQQVATKTLQYRHRLIPYLYSLSVKAATSGESIVEPIYYDYPKSTEAYKNKNQFMFGDQMMVLPITSPSDAQTKLARVDGWLPPARWVDLSTGTVYDGDRWISLFRSLEDYPVLSQEGSIIPLDGKHGSEIENGASVPESIEIVLVVGANGSFDLMEDNGKGAGIQDVELSSTPIRYDQSTGSLTIGPAQNPLMEERTWSVKLVSHTPKSVSLQVDSLESVPTPKVKDQILKLGKFSTTSTITLSLGSDPQLDIIDPRPKIFSLLQDAKIGIDLKGDIWDALQGKSSLSITLSRLNAVGAPAKIKEAVEELLLADGRLSL